MKKLIVIRAGNPTWEEENRIQGTLPLPLSQESMQAMDQVAGQLAGEAYTYIYSSGNESSGVTAAYLAKQCGKKTREIPSLHEPNYGLWQGLCLNEIRERFQSVYKQWRSDPTVIRPPQGESIPEAFTRIREALRRLEKKSGEKTVVLVAARTVAALVACAKRNIELERLWDVESQASLVQVFEEPANQVAGQAQDVADTGEKSPFVVVRQRETKELSTHLGRKTPRIRASI